jgi:hypothetical protein
MNQHKQLSCENITVIDDYWGTTKTYHDSNCQPGPKVSLEKPCYKPVNCY